MCQHVVAPAAYQHHGWGMKTGLVICAAAPSQPPRAPRCTPTWHTDRRAPSAHPSVVHDSTADDALSPKTRLPARGRAFDRRAPISVSTLAFPWRVANLDTEEDHKTREPPLQPVPPRGASRFATTP